MATAYDATSHCSHEDKYKQVTGCLQIQPNKFPRDFQDIFNALLMSVDLIIK